MTFPAFHYCSAGFTRSLSLSVCRSVAVSVVRLGGSPSLPFAVLIFERRREPSTHTVHQSVSKSLTESLTLTDTKRLGDSSFIEVRVRALVHISLLRKDTLGHSGFLSAAERLDSRYGTYRDAISWIILLPKIRIEFRITFKLKCTILDLEKFVCNPVEGNGLFLIC